jgi:hypothetical protein
MTHLGISKRRERVYIPLAAQLLPLVNVLKLLSTLKKSGRNAVKYKICGIAMQATLAQS